MKTKTMNSPTKHRSSLKRGTSLSYDSRNLHSIPKIPENQLITELKLSNNPLTNFRGLRTIPSLEFLRCDNTKIESFEDACCQPKLQNLNLSKTPVSMFRLYRIMAIIVFGDSLELINYIHLKQSEKSKASFLRERLYDQLVQGWILTSTEPLRIYNPKTKARRIIYMPQPLKTMMTLYPERTSPTSSPKKKTSPSVTKQQIHEDIQEQTISNETNEQQQYEIVQNAIELAEEEEDEKQPVEDDLQAQQAVEDYIYETEQHEEEQNEQQQHEEEQYEQQQHEEEQNEDLQLDDQELNLDEPDQVQNKETPPQFDNESESEPEHGPVPDYAEDDIPFEEQVRRDNEERFVQIEPNEEGQKENIPEQTEQPEQNELPPQESNQDWVINPNENQENAEPTQNEDGNSLPTEQNNQEEEIQLDNTNQEAEQPPEEPQPPQEEHPQDETQPQDHQEEEQKLEQTENQDSLPPQDQNQNWVLPEGGEQPPSEQNEEQQPEQNEEQQPEQNEEQQPEQNEEQQQQPSEQNEEQQQPEQNGEQQQPEQNEDLPVTSEPGNADQAPLIVNDDKVADQEEQPKDQDEQPNWVKNDDDKKDDDIDLNQFDESQNLALTGGSKQDDANGASPENDAELDALLDSLQIETE